MADCVIGLHSEHQKRLKKKLHDENIKKIEALQDELAAQNAEILISCNTSTLFYSVAAGLGLVAVAAFKLM